MTLDWDQIGVIAAVVGAITFFVVRWMQKKKSNGPGCASGCGCTSNMPGGKRPSPQTPEP